MCEDGWKVPLEQVDHLLGWLLVNLNKLKLGLACCASWGHKESDTTEQLNLTELMAYIFLYKLILFSLATGASSLSTGERGLRQ